MAELNRSRACLRFFGDDLVPDEITKILGAHPTDAKLKGEITRLASGKARVSQTGSWRLDAPEQAPGDINLQVEWILSQLSGELGIWRQLNQRFQIDCFCGLFLKEGNEGLSLSAQTLAALGLRGIEVDFDIYGADHLRE